MITNHYAYGSDGSIEKSMLHCEKPISVIENEIAAERAEQTRLRSAIANERARHHEEPLALPVMNFGTGGARLVTQVVDEGGKEKPLKMPVPDFSDHLPERGEGDGSFHTVGDIEEGDDDPVLQKPDFGW